MAEPASTLGDGEEDDGDEPVIECAELNTLYAPTDEDEIRRAWCLGALVNTENIMISGLLDTVDAFHAWLKDGTIKRKSESKFKVVKE